VIALRSLLLQREAEHAAAPARPAGQLEQQAAELTAARNGPQEPVLRNDHWRRPLAHPSQPGAFVRFRSAGFNTLKAHPTSTLTQDRSRAGLAGIDNLPALRAIS
jgi:hypothetical protein